MARVPEEVGRVLPQMMVAPGASHLGTRDRRVGSRNPHPATTKFPSSILQIISPQSSTMELQQ